MDMDIFFLQLAIVFLPGVIWARIDASYCMRQKPAQTEILIRSFLFGLTTYAVLYLIYLSIGEEFPSIDLPNQGSQFLIIDGIGEIIIASIPTSFALSLFWIYAVNKKLMSRFLHKIGFTKRYGDEDVWDYTFNSPDPAVEYVHVRDFDKRLVFAGWVSLFSESDKLRELVLRDVQVFNLEENEQGGAVEPLYSIPRLYLARDPTNIHIEFPYQT